jgi:predicted heme/steroid binding protein
MKKILSLGILVLIGVTLIGCGTSTINNSTSGSIITTSNSKLNATTKDALKVFTLSELAKYNGNNGSKSYIAVDGIVYDVTRYFVNGYHQGMHLAGTDATAVFNASPHSKSMLSLLPVVGKLQ